MVLPITVPPNDRNHLGRRDVVPGSESRRLCECEDIDEEFRRDVNGESSAHFESAPEQRVDQRQIITRRKEQGNVDFSSGVWWGRTEWRFAHVVHNHSALRVRHDFMGVLVRIH